MADKNRSEKSVDNIQEQIAKLIEEKEELERRNREKQQQELRAIKENAAARTSSTAVSPGERSSFGSSRDYSDRALDLNASLAENQHRRRSMQQNITNSSLEGTSFILDESADDVDDDDVMLPAHKQALRENRDVLVENMTPDDIFNDLISKHILSNADVSRIKDRNTTEAINEELLNVLIRRSERAFHVFVASLRRTLQGWLANRIDPGSPQKSKRKRRTGEMSINLSCDRIVPVSRKKEACSCKQVEEQVLIMANAAFSHIRRKDGTASAFEQFKKELKQTNEVLRESIEIVNTLKELCRHGEITDLTEGSVCFTIRCSSLSACQELWEAYETGVLLQVFQEGLVNSTLLNMCRASEIYLRLSMSRWEYLECALELAYQEEEALQLVRSKSIPVKRRLRKKLSIQKENTSRIGSKVLRHKRGHAFQEIPVNVVTSSAVVHDQSFVNRCGKYASISETQPPSAPPKRTHEASEDHYLVKHSSWGNTSTAERATGMDKWLRSSEKELPVCDENAFSLNITQNNTPGNLRNASQTTSGSKESYTRSRQDVCPYNLRYRLMNN